MIRMSTTTTATTKRMWMNPPIVYDETYPNNQRTIKITAIVLSILTYPYAVSQATPIIQQVQKRLGALVAMFPWASLDHLIRSGQHRRIDHELEFRRLFHWKIGR